MARNGNAKPATVKGAAPNGAKRAHPANGAKTPSNGAKTAANGAKSPANGASLRGNGAVVDAAALEAVEQALRAAAAGDFDIRLPGRRRDSLGRLEAAYNQL